MVVRESREFAPVRAVALIQPHLVVSVSCDGTGDAFSSLARRLCAADAQFGANPLIAYRLLGRKGPEFKCRHIGHFEFPQINTTCACFEAPQIDTT